MKTTLLFLSTLAILSIGITGCPDQLPDASTQEIALGGLTCDMCVTKVEKALAALDGVDSYTVDLEAKLATVRFEASKITLASIESAIADAGFTANGTSRSEQAHAELPACCQSSETVDM